MIRKTFSAPYTKVLDPARGLVEAIFSVTGNVDRQNDRILPGAFTAALAAKSSVPVVYAHTWDDINQVLGKTVQWRELMPGSPDLPDSLRGKGLGGVKALIQFELGVPSGQVAFTHVKNKNVTDWSWAFDIADGGEEYDNAGVRNLKSIAEIFEVTLALIGANQETMTAAVRKTAAMQSTSRAVEAEQWARINQYIAKQIGAEESRPTATRVIPQRTHVEKWIDDNEARLDSLPSTVAKADLPMTIPDYVELMDCLDRDDPSLTRPMRSLTGSHAMTPNEFKRLVESLTPL